MALRCPVCKADNSAPTCRRCKADLTLVFALEEDRAAMMARAREMLRSERWADAQALAMRADALRRDEASQRLVAIASLLCGDHHQAWRTWRLMAGEGRSPA